MTDSLTTEGKPLPSDKAHEAIHEAAELIANCYCSEDDVFDAETRRLVTAIADIVDEPHVDKVTPEQIVYNVAQRDVGFRKHLIEQLTAMGDAPDYGEFKELPTEERLAEAYRVQGDAVIDAHLLSIEIESLKKQLAAKAPFEWGDEKPNYWAGAWKYHTADQNLEMCVARPEMALEYIDELRTELERLNTCESCQKPSTVHACHAHAMDG